MTIHLSEKYRGDMLYIHVCGNLFKADFDQCVRVEPLVPLHGSYKLFDMTGFATLDAGAVRKDTKFVIRYFAPRRHWLGNGWPKRNNVP